MLHELDHLQALLRANDAARAAHAARRLRAILKTVVAQVDVIETMTPLEFSAFRGFLESASGFQSAQFRALEFVFGYKRESVLRHFPPDSDWRLLLEDRFARPSLWDAFLRYLTLNGYAVPAELIARDVTHAVAPSADLQAMLVTIYRTDPAVRNVCEGLVDLDEGIQEWRYRHVKMVERTIGARAGTGGSPGVPYLASTLNAFFPDLWAIRSLL
jgi:tryptophan 2,3-dioxygenase